MRIAEQSGRLFTQVDVARFYEGLPDYSQRLDTHFGSHTQPDGVWARVAMRLPSDANSATRSTIATLAWRHQEKVKGESKSAKLRIANTDINGRFVDGSGQVAVGKPNVDEFAQLRAFGRLASEHWDSAWKFLAGTVHLLNPVQTLPTPESRYTTRMIEQAAVGFAQFLSANPFDAAYEDGLAVRSLLDDADALSRLGDYEQAANLRADALVQLLAGVGAVRLFKGHKTKTNVSEESIPAPRVDVSARFEPTFTSTDGRIRKYKYQVSGDHFLKATIENGTLSDYIWVNPALRAQHGGGRDMLLSLMLRLKEDAVPVTRIQQEWIRGVGDNHRDYFLNKQILKMTPDSAALNTWSGRFWSDLGYKKIRPQNESDSSVILLFER